jgi:hypothetical protein
MTPLLKNLKRLPAGTLGLLRYRNLYTIAVIIFLIVFKVFWSPDVLFLVFLTIFAVYGHGKEYIRKFTPFVALLVSYDALRGVVPLISKRVNYTPMINFDKWLFHGHLPVNILQGWLYHGTLHWYDYYFYFVYMLHFLAPFIIAALIWKYRPGRYWQFAAALLTLSYAAFITYIIFPAAPPWMASDAHLIPKITKLSSQIWWAWGVRSVPTIYASFNPNPVAAVPSLHAAYPMLDLLFVHKFFGRKAAIPFAIYPISVWIGVVYLGEHYVFDVLMGILYAVGTFYATEFVIAKGWHRPIAHRVRSFSPPWTKPKRIPVSAVSPESLT